MTDTDRITEIKDFCEMIKTSLDKNKPMDYKGAEGLLEHILIIINKDRRNRG